MAHWLSQMTLDPLLGFRDLPFRLSPWDPGQDPVRNRMGADRETIFPDGLYHVPGEHLVREILCSLPLKLPEDLTQHLLAFGVHPLLQPGFHQPKTCLSVFFRLQAPDPAAQSRQVH